MPPLREILWPDMLQPDQANADDGLPLYRPWAGNGWGSVFNDVRSAVKLIRIRLSIIPSITGIFIPRKITILF